MGCFPCFQKSKQKDSVVPAPVDAGIAENNAHGAPSVQPSVASALEKQSNGKDVIKDEMYPTSAKVFRFRELAAATQNFRAECLLGEGGFGRVYKGTLETGQMVAVKQLDRNGLQGNREFLVEVLMLSLVHHQNLVNLIGYCADGDQRLLVYEYMPNGSLEDHLHDLPPGKQPLDWNTRLRIAAGAALGLEHLHDKTSPPVIYRDLKSSNILLDDKFHPKLSDFGLAKLGPVGDKSHVSTRVMGTYGYCAPEYAMTGQLTLKSDVYSFGVVMLELISGRKAIDCNKPTAEQNLVSWARPMFKARNKFPLIADPLLQGHYPMRALYQAIAIAAMCLQEQATTRPLMRDVVTALGYLSSQTYDPLFGSSIDVKPTFSSQNEKMERKLTARTDNHQVSEMEQIDAKGFKQPSLLKDSRKTETQRFGRDGYGEIMVLEDMENNAEKYISSHKRAKAPAGLVDKRQFV